jgi:hypothetical protein
MAVTENHEMSDGEGDCAVTSKPWVTPGEAIPNIRHVQLPCIEGRALALRMPVIEKHKMRECQEDAPPRTSHG